MKFLRYLSAITQTTFLPFGFLPLFTQRTHGIGIASQNSSINLTGIQANLGGPSRFYGTSLNLNDIQTSNRTVATNQSAGGSIGVVLSRQATGFNISANGAKGNEIHTSTDYVPTRFNSTGGEFDLSEATNINGSVGDFGSITGQMGKVTITSHASSDDYASNQRNASAGVTIGPASGLNAQFGKQTIKSEYDGVQTQAALIATDGINANMIASDGSAGIVLNGGALIGSANPHNNQITTSGVQYSNMVNNANWSAKNIQFSTSNPIANPIHKDKGQASSLTQATLSEGSITYTQGTANEFKDLSSLNRNPATAHTLLQPIFDASSVREQWAYNDAVNGATGAVAGEVAGWSTIKAQVAKNDAIQATKLASQALAKEPSNLQAQAALKTAQQAEQRAQSAIDEWRADGSKGKYLYGIANGLNGALTGQGPAASLALASRGLLAEQLHGEDTINRVLGHAVIGCALTSLTGGGGSDCAAAALGSSASVLLAPTVVTILYGDTPVSQLSAQQRDTVAAVSSLTSALAGAAVGGTSGAAVAGDAARNEVVNNFLSRADADKYRNALKVCNGDSDCEADARKKAIAAYQRNEDALQLAILRGDLAAYNALLATAATASEIPFDGTNTFTSRANTLSYGVSTNTERTIKEIAGLRNDLCGGVSASACDYKINELRAQGDAKALTLVSLAMGAGVGSQFIGAYSKAKAIGAGIGGVANAAAQLTSSGKIDISDVLVATGTGYIAPSYGLVGNVVINTAGYGVQQGLNGEPPTTAGAAATAAGTIMGYGVGKAAVSTTLTKTTNSAGQAIWKLPAWSDKLYPSGATRLLTTSPVPGVVGNFWGSAIQEYSTPKIQKRIESQPAGYRGQR